jgi:hypothetical protein
MKILIKVNKCVSDNCNSFFSFFLQHFLIFELIFEGLINNSWIFMKVKILLNN